MRSKTKSPQFETHTHKQTQKRKCAEKKRSFSFVCPWYENVVLLVVMPWQRRFFVTSTHAHHLAVVSPCTTQNPSCVSNTSHHRQQSARLRFPPRRILCQQNLISRRCKNSWILPSPAQNSNIAIVSFAMTTGAVCGLSRKPKFVGPAGANFCLSNTVPIN